MQYPKSKPIVGERWLYTQPSRSGIVDITVSSNPSRGRVVKECPDLGKVGQACNVFYTYDTWKQLRNQNIIDV